MPTRQILGPPASATSPTLPYCRGLSQRFMDDLLAEDGLLLPLLRRVKADSSLCMELRENYLNIYYRGGNLLKLDQTPAGYSAVFDSNYYRGATRPLIGLPAVIRTRADVESWLEDFPLLKNAIDLFPHHKAEREVQQVLVADNNFFVVARTTDYYICDIEYANVFGRFDFLAVHWPSSSSNRIRQTGKRLVLGEVKYGDGALEGAAGLHSHVRDVNEFLGDPARVSMLKSEMVSVFNQKRKLGLVNCGKDLLGFSDQKPLLLLVLANHDPDKSALRKLLESLPPCPNAELRVASACFMGYGLYDPAILTVQQALENLGAVK